MKLKSLCCFLLPQPLSDAVGRNTPRSPPDSDEDGHILFYFELVVETVLSLHWVPF